MHSYKITGLLLIKGHIHCAYIVQKIESMLVILLKVCISLARCFHILINKCPLIFYDNAVIVVNLRVCQENSLNWFSHKALKSHVDREIRVNKLLGDKQ